MELTVKELLTREEIYETGTIYIDCIRQDYCFKPKLYLDSLKVDGEAEECFAFMESDKAHNKLFGAFLCREMAGYIATARTKVGELDHLGEIAGLFVRKEYRGQRIGLRLLKTACEFLKEKGFEKIVIYNYTKSQANLFYRSLGGTVLKQEVQYPGGMALDTDIFIYGTDELLTVLHGKLFPEDKNNCR